MEYWLRLAAVLVIGAAVTIPVAALLRRILRSPLSCVVAGAACLVFRSYADFAWPDSSHFLLTRGIRAGLFLVALYCVYRMGWLVRDGVKSRVPGSGGRT